MSTLRLMPHTTTTYQNAGVVPRCTKNATEAGVIDKSFTGVFLMSDQSIFG